MVDQETDQNHMDGTKGNKISESVFISVVNSKIKWIAKMWIIFDSLFEVTMKIPSEILSTL